MLTCNTFDLYLAINGLENQFLVFLRVVVLHRFYCKCSKIVNAFFFLFFNKIMIIRAGIHKMNARIANREDPDQTASEEN